MDRRRKQKCSNPKCGKIVMLKDMSDETEKSAGRYYINYHCPHCHEYMGFEVEDGTYNYEVIETSFGLTDQEKRDIQREKRQMKKAIAEAENNHIEAPTHWRTLVTFEEKDEESNLFGFIIPGWNPYQTVYFEPGIIPSFVLEKIEEGYGRFHAHVVLGAEDAKDLHPILWEDS